MVIEIELFIILALLVTLIIRLSSFISLAKIFDATNPFFPVFDRDVIHNTKLEYLVAKQEFNDLLGLIPHGEIKDQQRNEFQEQFNKAERNFSFAEERLHRLLQANIAACNGGEISAIKEDYEEWFSAHFGNCVSDR